MNPFLSVARLEFKADCGFDWGRWVWTCLAMTAVLACCSPAALAQRPTRKLEAAATAEEPGAVFLDDLQETGYTTLNQKLGKHGETSYPGEDVKHCRIGTTELKHALSTHPTQEKDAVVTYALEKKYRRLRTLAALTYPTPDDGLTLAMKLGWTGKALAPLRFRVVGDGKVLWESKPLQKHGDALECDISVEGVDQLRLECHCAGMASFAWAFWGNPRLIPLEGQNSTAAPSADPNVIAPRIMELPGLASAMALTEDGKFLIVAHQVTSTLSVWDVLAEKLVKTVATPAPRFVMCRGDRVFAVNNAEGTISMFSRAKNWGFVKKLETGSKNVVHISAPRGDFFKDELIATCHGPGAEGSERGVSNVLIDTKLNKYRNLAQAAAVATYSYDGKVILTQSPFRSSGEIGGFTQAGYVGGKATPIFAGAMERGYYISQEHPGPLWYGGNVVMAGAPNFVGIPAELGGRIIPDLSQRVLYAINDETLRAHRLDPTLALVGERPIRWQPKKEDYTGIANVVERHRHYTLDIPQAYTHGQNLHLFMIDGAKDRILMARTAALATPPAGGVLLAGVSSLPTLTPSEKPASPATSPMPAGAEKPDPNVIEPRVLELADLASAMALTEDGKHLIVAHQGSNSLSVWDVLADKVVKTIETPAPRFVMCRGNKVFIINNGEGTISLFARDKNWELVNQFETGSKNIVHISAPRGEFFKDELLATSHGQGPTGSYSDVANILVDTKLDKHRKLARADSVATYSYDGKIVVTQGSFNLSPAGGIGGFPQAAYVGRNASPIFRGDRESLGYVSQEHPGPFWYGGSVVVGGVPNCVKIPGDLGGRIIPDLSQRVLYSINEKAVRAHRLDATLAVIGERPIQWQPRKEDYAGIIKVIERHRHYTLDTPQAYTHGPNLHLFMLDGAKNCIVAARTLAIVTPPAGGVQLAPSAIAGAGAGAGGQPVAEVDEWGLPKRIADGTKLDTTMKAEVGAEFELLGGPEGLQLTKAGRLTWATTKEQIGPHELKVRIKAGTKVSIVRPRVEVVDKELIASAGSLAAADKGERLPLEVDNVVLVPSQNHASLLLLQGDRLRELGGTGLKVVSDQTLPKRYQLIATRGTDLLAVSNDPNQFDIIDRKTNKVRKSIKLDLGVVRILEITDMVPHPTKPVSYIAFRHSTEVPRYRFMIVNESTGKLEAPESAIAKWLRIDPAGRYLYSGFEDLYRIGTDFHVNPGFQIIESPKYDNIDWVITYDLKTPRLKPVDIQAQAGGNGAGIVLSADGKRITYLSHVGTPVHSENLVAWNPTKLKDTPVTYAVKGRGTTKLLAFHPTLPIVAIPGSGSAVLFDREKGTELKDKLQLTSQGLGEVKVEELFFTADGSGLIFDCNDLEGRYLRRVGLRLTKEEQATAAKGVAKAAEVAAAVPDAASPPKQKQNLVRILRSEVGALKQAGKTESLSAREINTLYADSIVLITTSNGTGTGFAVGKDGLVLTCAHVRADEGEISVTYSVVGKEKPETAVASLVRVDTDRDLALLKIKSPPLSCVVLGVASAGAAGESVTVIGNPGLGDAILSRTLTTGVISSVSRMFEGQEYIQTSAPINAGTSGGPMFDSSGRVIGLVVLKATTNEATAFAVPVKGLRKFLEEATAVGTK